MYPDLELVITKRWRSRYVASFRLRSTDNPQEPRWETAPFRIDAEFFESDALLSNFQEYGARLGRALFKDPKAQDAWQQAQAVGVKLGKAFRFRLSTDQASTELQRLRWELLRIPSFHEKEFDDSSKSLWIGNSNGIFFSRHLHSSDMRPIQLRAQADLSALVVIANPPALADPGSNLPPLDVDAEWKIAELGLAPARPSAVVSDKERIPPEGKAAARVTLKKLLEELKREPDILYLVCHGTVDRDEPWLLLENDAGDLDLISGDELIKALRGLLKLPRLVVLVSCQSAGEATPVVDAAAQQATLVALGPKLAEAGVSAVLAMQGNFSHASASEFLPEFFRVLKLTGQVDEAVALARTKITSPDDAWMPVLYTRLVEGRVWYVRGLKATKGETDIAWRQLCIDINSRKCLPILGSGLLEPFMGSTLELAYTLAKENSCPLSRSSRDDLPQISQYLQTMGLGKDARVQVQILDTMKDAILRRYPQLSEIKLQKFSPGSNVETLLEAAWNLYRAEHPYEPHMYLAGHAKLNTFLTMNADKLMELAIKQVRGIDACSYYPRWAKNTLVETVGDEKSPAKIYHLAGSLDNDDSLLATEDDYFRFLAATSRLSSQHRTAGSNEDLAVSTMLGAVAKSDWLFLGFRHTDWDFRTLCKLLTSSEDGMVAGKVHIAVQVNPEEGTAEDVNRTREYVSRLFDVLVGKPLNAQVGMYWGSAEDFLEELDEKWKS